MKDIIRLDLDYRLNERKKQLQELYTNKKLTEAETAKKIGCSQSLIHYWLVKHSIKRRSKSKRIITFNDIPSKELSYIIGSVYGDCHVAKNTKGHNLITFYNKSSDYLREINKNLSILLNKKTPYKIVNNKSWKGVMRINCSARNLWDFVRTMDTQQVMKISNNYPRDFLRTLFNAEGSCYFSKGHGKFRISCSSNNRQLLEIVSTLLKTKFNIHATIVNSHKKGTIIKNKNTSKKYVRKNDSYSLKIHRTQDIFNFHKKIGFAVKHKQLIKYILLIDIDTKLLKLWKTPYEKTRKVILKEMQLMIEEIILKPSDKKGYHYYFHVWGKSMSSKDLNMIQYLMGDDTTRVWINHIRLGRGIKKWNKMFAKVIYRKPPAKPCPVCRKTLGILKDLDKEPK